MFSRSGGEDPGGTAPSWASCLFIELPRPWAEYVDDTDHFPKGVLDVLDRADLEGGAPRLQCIAPDREYSVNGHVRVMHFSTPAGPFSRYDKDEYLVPNDKVVALTEALMEHPEALQDFHDYRQDTASGRDIFVCSHGSHDTCCATFGYPVFEALRGKYAGVNGNGLRVFQVSHLGGHRFAPNVLDMPQGRNWVRLGVEDLDALVHRDRTPPQPRHSYRGLVALDTQFEQLVEREAFILEGWGWLNKFITTHVLSVSDGERGADVRIEFAASNGESSGAYRATVEQSGTVPRVSCRLDEPNDDDPQYSVSPLLRVS